MQCAAISEAEQQLSRVNLPITALAALAKFASCCTIEDNEIM